MIEAVCWDVGGVFTGRPVDAVARVAAAHGLDADAVFTAVFGPYHLDSDHPWHRIERGEMPLADAWVEIEAAVGELGASFALADLFRGFGEDPVDRTIVAETCVTLHEEGLAMAVITNNVKEFSHGDGGGWRSIVPMEVMRVVVDSSAVGMRKPDPAIFRHTLAELGVVPEAAVFLDDMAANVESARSLGMHGIVVDADPSEAMVELRALIDAHR